MEVEKDLCPICHNICLGNVYYTAGFKRWQCQLCGNEFVQSASVSGDGDFMIPKKKSKLNIEGIDDTKELILSLKEDINKRLDIFEMENEKLLRIAKRLLIGDEYAVDRIVKKIQKCEDLYEDEIITLLHKGNIIDEIERGILDNYKLVQTILDIDGQLYQIDWQRSMFEYRDHKYLNQPYKVEKIEKVVIEYNPIENNNI